MRILSIVWYKVLPAKFGGQKGIACFLHHLAKHAELDCLCSRNNEQTAASGYSVIPELPLSRLQFFNPIVWLKILRRARKKKYDWIILEHPYHAFAGLLARLFTRSKLAVHCHNIEASRFRETGKKGWRLLQLYENFALRRANLVFVKTEADRDYLINRLPVLPEKILLVPYGIDPAEKKTDRHAARFVLKERHGTGEAEKIFLFAGTLDYLPNARAVENIYKKLAPLFQSKMSFVYRIIICGRNQDPRFAYLHSFKDDRVIMAGEVDDINTYFAAADVFINPVETGGGVQTKIIDAVHAGLPVVCFEQMPEGIPPATVAGKLFPAQKKNWEEFANQAAWCCVQPPAPVPAAFYERFSWPVITAKVAAFLKEGTFN